jgi:hypothetical protein
MGSEPERGAPEREPGPPEGVPAPSPEAAAAHEEAVAEEQRYIDDLIARGEAVPEGEELPPGATHEIVVDENGRRTVRRKRFSAY